MSKWFEVTIQACKVMAVEMEDDATEEDAFDFALSESGVYDSMTEAAIEELKTQEQIDTSIRHADQVERL